MTKKSDVYRCERCGNMVEVLHIGGGGLSCCNQEMTLVEGNSTDAATEKHVPVITTVDGGVSVSVGSTLHPMAEDHYIEWIEVVADGVVSRTYLAPGDAPTVTVKTAGKTVTARAYCNTHGLWTA